MNGVVEQRWTMLASIKSKSCLDLKKFCGLDVVVNESTLMLKDGSLVSSHEMLGTASLVGEEDFTNQVDRLRRMASSLKNHGHEIQVVFVRDLKRGERELEKICKVANLTQEQKNMNLESLFDSKKQSLSEQLTFERTILTVRTHLSAIEASERKKAFQSLTNFGKNTPAVGSICQSMLNEHIAFEDNILQMFSHFSELKALHANEILSIIKEELEQDEVSNTFKIHHHLSDNKVPMNLVSESKADPSHLLIPSIADQIHSHAAEVCEDDKSIITCNGQHFTSVSIDRGPSSPFSFSELFNILGKNTPYRISFRFHTNHKELVGKLGLPAFISQLLAITSDKNKKIHEAIKQIQSLSADETHGTTFISMATWSDSPKTTRQQRSRLIAALQQWGGSTCLVEKGIPYLGIVESIPGFYSIETASTPLLMPFFDVATMMPLFRPKRPWKFGHHFCKTFENQFYPIEQFSMKMAANTTLVVGPSGKGKSNLIAQENASLIYFSGNGHFPFQAIVDVGGSSTAYGRFIESLLPFDKKHWVQIIRVKNTRDESINVFDTPLGYREPDGLDKNFVCSFLKILLNVTDKDVLMSNFCARLVKEAYAFFANPQTGKTYRKHIDSSVDSALDQLNISLEEGTTWWEVVDILFDENFVHEAHLAQRMAVPNISDLPEVINQVGILRKKFGQYIKDGMTVIDWANILLPDAINRFPSLTKESTISLGNSRIRILNLEDVVRGNDFYQTQLFYSAAIRLSTSDFLLDKDALSSQCPKKYRAFHENRLDTLSATEKCLTIDELHRTKPKESVLGGPIIEQVVGLAKEARKYKLKIMLGSQQPHDFGDDLVELADFSFIMTNGGGTASDKLQKRYGYSDDVRKIIERHVEKPGEFLFIAKTKTNTIYQALTSLQSPYELWAYEPLEVAKIRENLAECFGYERAIRLLMAVWETPAALKRELGSLKRTKDFSSSGGDVIDRLSDKAKQLAPLIFKKGSS